MNPPSNGSRQLRGRGNRSIADGLCETNFILSLEGSWCLMLFPYIHRTYTSNKRATHVFRHVRLVYVSRLTWNRLMDHSHGAWKSSTQIASFVNVAPWFSRSPAVRELYCIWLWTSLYCNISPNYGWRNRSGLVELFATEERSLTDELCFNIFKKFNFVKMIEQFVTLLQVSWSSLHWIDKCLYIIDFNKKCAQFLCLIF